MFWESYLEDYVVMILPSAGLEDYFDAHLTLSFWDLNGMVYVMSLWHCLALIGYYVSAQTFHLTISNVLSKI